MDKYQWFHGQVVTAKEMEEALDEVENAERDLALEGGISQVAYAASPSSNVFGGISSGFVVSAGTDNTYAVITAGKARDNSGRRIATPLTAYVKVSHAGTTLAAAGEVGTASAPVQPTGGDITGSCIAGARIVASLFIVFTQKLSNARTDALGHPVQYDVTESFYFSIEITSSHTNPPTGAPSRAALADGKVLISDLVLTNDASVMKIVEICNSSADWTALGGDYALHDGRRSDVVALDAYAGTSPAFEYHIRNGSVRDALYAVVRQQTTIAPPFFDDFTYQAAGAGGGGGSIDADVDLRPKWRAGSVTGANLTILGATWPNSAGGILSVGTDSNASASPKIYTGFCWNLHSSPWAKMRVRLRIPSFVSSGDYVVGFVTAGASPTSLGLYIDGLAGTCHPYVRDTAGASVVGDAVTTITPNVWYVLDILPHITEHSVMVRSGSAAKTAVAAGSISTQMYRAEIYVNSSADPTDMHIDWILIEDQAAR